MLWNDAKHIGFDVETDGILAEYALQPWRFAKDQAWLTSSAAVRVESDGLTHTIHEHIMPSRQAMISLLELAIATNSRLVGWSVSFDISWLIAMGLEDLVMQVRWLDGMLLWRHVAVEPSYDLSMPHRKKFGLKQCVKELWPDQAGYEDDIKFHNPSAEELHKLMTYNIRDSSFALAAAKHWWGLMSERQQAAALIEAQALPLAAKANLHGMPVDTLVLHELQALLTKTAADRLEELEPHGVTETIIRSPKQLSALIFDQWKLPTIKGRSTDKEVLHELSFHDPRAKQLREYREALNNRTKFADGPLVSAEYNADGCTHPQVMLYSTYSGRATYSSKQGKGKDERPIGFALHQQKRDKKFRNSLVAPPGYVIVEFDAAGQEFRWMAIESGDEVMLQLCMPGEDPHAFMGASIYGLDYRETIQRYKADDPAVAGPEGIRMFGKVGNLSLQYRTGYKRLCSVARVQYKLPMEIPQAQTIHRIYPQTYRGVPVYWNRQIARAKQQGYVETFAGRRVQVVGDWTGDRGWSMESTALNFPVQGVGADQKYLALAVLRSYLTEVGAHFAWDLHDGLYFFVPEAKAMSFAIEGKRRLDNLPYRQAWGLTPPIPMPWDAHIGFSWGTLRGVEHA